MYLLVPTHISENRNNIIEFVHTICIYMISLCHRFFHNQENLIIEYDTSLSFTIVDLCIHTNIDRRISTECLFFFSKQKIY